MSVAPQSSSNSPLPPDSKFTSTSFDRRKKDARDIVSSFDQNLLPSEYNPDIYRRITDEQSQRSSSEWTIIANLPGTVMQWAVHDRDCWAFLNKCQPSNIRALLFIEKLRRRFEQEFKRYDEIANPAHHESEAQSLSPAHVQFIVAQVADGINSLVGEALLDLDDRSVGQGGTAKVLLDALEAICIRSNNISPAQWDQSTSGTELEMSLYDILIRRPPSGTPTMILEALERASGTSPGILSAMTTQFETIGNILRTTGTPYEYWQRFQKLSTQAGVMV